MIYQTDGAEAGRLLLREPILTTVAAPMGADEGSEWGGLSGALVFHLGRALGVIVEHHPRQGSSAVQLVAIDQVADLAATDAETAKIADAVSLPKLGALPLTQAQPIPALAGLVPVLVNGQLPLVAGLDPYRLGATVSDYGNSDTYGLRDPYVPRTHDEVDIRLRAALQPGHITLVVGPSKAGKTRTAFEAALAMWPSAAVAVPAPDELSSLASHPRVQATSDIMLIWLDDLQRYLTGRDPLTPKLLTQFTSRPGPTLLLATLRQEERDKLRQNTGEFAVDTRAVLQFAEPTTVELRHTTSDPAEQAAAAAAYPATNLDNAGLAEALAHAPALLEEYRDSAAVDPVRHITVRVVIDWARTGMVRPLPESHLITLVRDAVWVARPDLDIDDGRIISAIAWGRMALPGTGSAALLRTYALPDRTRGYRPFDYLVAADNGQGGHARSIPESFWDQVLFYATAHEAGDIGNAAYYRNNTRVAIVALQEAAKAGDYDALRRLGYVRANALDPPDLEGARAAFQQAADAGHTGAAFSLGVLLATQLNPPDLDGARAAYQQAAELWHASLESEDEAVMIPAVINLATLAAASDDYPHAVRLLRRAADLGVEAALDYAEVLDTDTRPAACERLRERSDTDSLNFRGIAAYADGKWAEAQKLWTTSHERQDAVAPLLLFMHRNLQIDKLA